MGVIDFILNLAGLLLWLNWRAEKADPVGRRKPATLLGTLRRVDKERYWQLPALVAVLVFLRALLYWQIGAALHWSAKLNFGVIALPFRSDFGSMLLFSVCSFALTLAVFYLCLLLLSILDGPEPFRTFVRQQLGGVDAWRRETKLLLPLLAASALWWLAVWLFARLEIIPSPASEWRHAGQAIVVGAGSYLAWEYVAIGLLAFHLVNSYVYFGKQPLWTFVNAEAQTLLRPLKKIPLRAGRVDFSPVVGIGLVFFAATFAGRLLAALYERF